MLRRTMPARGLGRPLARPGLLSTVQSARLHRLHAGVSIWRAEAERAHLILDAWERQLLTAVDDSACPAQAGWTESQLATGPALGSLAPAAPAVASTAVEPASVELRPRGSQPPTAVLSQIFERVRPRTDLTDSGYPKMDVVDDELAEWRIGPADTAYVRRQFDAWLHARAREDGQIDERHGNQNSDPRPLERPTAAVLVAVFETLDLDDPDLVTRAGVPRVAAVNARLPSRYLDADPDDVADVFADWWTEREDVAVPDEAEDDPAHRQAEDEARGHAAANGAARSRAASTPYRVFALVDVNDRPSK